MRRRTWLPGLAFGSVLLLVGGVLLGLQVPGAGFLPGFPDQGRLDYSAGPPGGYAPLDGRLVRDLLGLKDMSLDPATAGPMPDRRELADQDLSRRSDADVQGDGAPVLVVHPFTNDSFADAYRVPRLPFTAETNTTTASAERGEPRSCSPIGGKTAWYAFRATRDIGLLADTFGTTSAAALTVYRGEGLDRLERIGACSSDPRGNALVPFPARAGTAYYFQVDGAVGGRTTFTLQEQGVTRRASVGSDGRQGDGDSILGVISESGRHVLMSSGASTLDDGKSTSTCMPTTGGTPVPGMVAPCGKIGLYDRDRVRHRTANAVPDHGILPAGGAAGSLVLPGSTSADGRYYVFWAAVQVHAPGSDERTPSSPYRFEVFRHDNRTGDNQRVSVPCRGCGADTNASSGRPEISDDGRFVAFVSWSTNLVPDDENRVRDVFVRDMRTGTTTRADVPSHRDRKALGEPNDDTSGSSPQGDQGADLFSISGDGRYVVFKSSSSNLVRDDTNGVTDVFVRDRAARITTRVNVSSTGAQADGETQSVLGVGLRTISDDGRYVFFNSDATNLVTPGTAPGVENVFRRDLRRGVTSLVTVSSTGQRADDGVKGDPRRLAFAYLAPVLIAGGANVSLSELSYSATRDGRFVVFNSDATNLVHGDGNRSTDVFLHDTARGATTRVSVSSDGTEAIGGPSGSPTISADGRFVAFSSAATNLVAGDTNRGEDVFVRELPGPRPMTGWY